MYSIKKLNRITTQMQAPITLPKHQMLMCTTTKVQVRVLIRDFHILEMEVTNNLKINKTSNINKLRTLKLIS